MKDNDLLLMEVMPRWNRFIGRAFKNNLPEGMSPPMHFLITHLRKPVSMTEMARVLRMSKQQMTKLADKVIAMGMAERINDPNDRRVILLQATPKTIAYLEESENQLNAYFRDMFNAMEPSDRDRLNSALSEMNEVFIHMERTEQKKNGKETD